MKLTPKEVEELQEKLLIVHRFISGVGNPAFRIKDRSKQPIGRDNKRNIELKAAKHEAHPLVRSGDTRLLLKW